MDTFTRRELFRRLFRAAAIGPVVLATRDQQADLLFRLSRLAGVRTVIGRWLNDLSWWW